MTLKRTLLMTRPAAQSAKFVAALGIDVPVITSPIIEIVPVISRPVAPDHVIFTSANAVTYAPPTDAIAWCVGPQTQDAARKAGYRTKTGLGFASDLVSLIKDERPVGKIIHFRGQHVREDVAAQLCALGFDCEDVVVYDQQARLPSTAMRAALGGTKPVILPLFSPRTASLIRQSCVRSISLHIVAISSAVMGEAAAMSSKSLVQATTPDQAGMIEAVVSVIERLNNNDVA